jgi:acyl-CoA synthetase (AMP-forming)/AMP-acid ligase II
MACDAAALLGHLEGRCARYRWPRHVVFWDALPKSGYGKVTKKDVRERLFARGELWEPTDLGKTRESSPA